MRRIAPLLDALSVVVFVSIGRSVHTGQVSLAGIASTAWPFAVGLALGCLLTRATRVAPVSARAGILVALATTVLGMVLRAVSGQGVAVAFVLVALGFLGATMLGWRLLLAIATQRSTSDRTRQ